jgi:uncharacterized protein
MPNQAERRGALDRKPGVVVVLIQAAVGLYQRFVSPALPRRCKYEPTCSAYVVSALRSYGAARGLVLGGWRLLRCNPFSHGGYDPVEAQTLFRRRDLGSGHVLAREDHRGDRRDAGPSAARGDCAKPHLRGLREAGV